MLLWEPKLKRCLNNQNVSIEHQIDISSDLYSEQHDSNGEPIDISSDLDVEKHSISMEQLFEISSDIDTEKHFNISSDSDNSNTVNHEEHNTNFVESEEGIINGEEFDIGMDSEGDMDELPSLDEPRHPRKLNISEISFISNKIVFSRESKQKFNTYLEVNNHAASPAIVVQAAQDSIAAFTTTARPIAL